MKRERRVSNLAFSCGSCVIEHTHLHKHSHAKPSYSCESVITGPFVYHETWNMILDGENNEVSELDGDDITCDLSTSSQKSSQPLQTVHVMTYYSSQKLVEIYMQYIYSAI